MVKEAAGAGLYDGPTGKVPKIQLFTIEELFAGRRPQIPLIERGFKTAAREGRNDQPQLELEQAPARWRSPILAPSLAATTRQQMLTSTPWHCFTPTLSRAAKPLAYAEGLDIAVSRPV